MIRNINMEVKDINSGTKYEIRLSRDGDDGKEINISTSDNYGNGIHLTTDKEGLIKIMDAFKIMVGE